MKKSRFTESQIIRILKEYEAGKSAKDLCRVNSISDATFYNWKKKNSGMDAAQLKKSKNLKKKTSA